MLSFEQFLSVESIQEIEQVTGKKVPLWERPLYYWWFALRDSNKHLSPCALFESVFKGRF